MWIQSLGREDPLEEEMATHSNIPATDRGAWWFTVHRVTKSGTRVSMQHTRTPTHTRHTIILQWLAMDSDMVASIKWRSQWGQGIVGIGEL